MSVVIGHLYEPKTCPFRKLHPASDSPRAAESSHDLRGCLRSCTRSECSSPIYSSRGAGLKPRIYFSDIALRRIPPRFRLRGSDRALLKWMIRLWPGLLGMARVVQPETILRWHRAGFKLYWRWQSRNRAGRPKIDHGLRDLIRRMSSRHIAPRVPGSNDHLRRDAPAPNSLRLCGVLQSSAHALGITERCALASSSLTIRRHCRHSDLGWTASPIRPDIIFGKDRSSLQGWRRKP